MRTKTTGCYRFTAGQTYTTALDYVHSPSATWKMELHWSSAGGVGGANAFPEETIEPAAPVGGNLPTPESLDSAGFGNAANGSAYGTSDGEGPLRNPNGGDWDTGNVVSGSTIITNLSSLSYSGNTLTIGELVQAPGVPAGDTVTGINPLNNSITLATAATATGSGVYVVLDAPAPLDSNGDPEGNFDLTSFDGPQNNQGVYTITFEGSASLSNTFSQTDATVGKPIKENFLSGSDALNTFTATMTSGSTTLTGVTNASLYYADENVFSADLPSTDYIASVNPATDTITLGSAATSSTTMATVAAYLEGSATTGSSVLTVVKNIGASNMYDGETVQGTGIPAGTTITSFDASGQTVTLSATVSTTSRTTLVLTQPENSVTYYPYSNTLASSAMSYDAPTGTGYNPSNNTTTILYLNSGGWDNLNFSQTDRNGYGAPGPNSTMTARMNGIANLRIAAPAAQTATTDVNPDSLFTTSYLDVFAPYAAIRSNETAWTVDDADSAASSDWTYRALPTAWNFTANANEAHTPYQPGLAPWEEEVLLSNATGKDLYVNLPESASDSYMSSLATLIQTGSSASYTYSGNATSGSTTITSFSDDENLFVGEAISGTGIPAGTTISAFSNSSGSLTTLTLSHAATASQSNDVLTITSYYPGLLPNLNVYIEYGNEIWNGGTHQQARVVADANAVKNSANDTADWANYLKAGGNATIDQSVNLNNAFNQTGIYTTASTFAAGAGFDDVGDAYVGGYLLSSISVATAISDYASVGFTSTPNTTGYQTISSGTENLREDFAVPANSTIAVDDLEAFAGGTTLGNTSGTEIQVALWQLNSTTNSLTGSGPLATATLTGSDSVQVGSSGFYQLTSFAPTALSSGHYAIIASYPANFDYYNSNITGATKTVSDSSGFISFPVDDGATANSNVWFFSGASYGTATTWSAPGATSATNAYGAGSFSYNFRPNVLSAQGQTLTTGTGSYDTLIVDAAAINGQQDAQSFVVNYTNGSATTLTQTVADWSTPLSPYTFNANVSSGSTTLTSATGINGLFNGEWISGTGIPSGTSITSFNTIAGTVTLSAAATALATGEALTVSPYSGTITTGSTIVTGVPYTVGLFNGETISRPGVPAGTTIVSIGAGTITLSQAVTTGASFAVALPDQETIATATPTYVTHTGSDIAANHYLYSYALSLNSAWTVASITVPNNSNVKIMSMTLQGNNPNAAGTVTAISGELWGVLRTQEASTMFRNVYGGASMPVTAATSSYPAADTPNPDPRIRPIQEQQQGNDTTNSGTGGAFGALNDVDYEVSQNANYYLYAIGAGWYGSDLDPTTSVSTFYADAPGKEGLSTNINGVDVTQPTMSDELTASEFNLHNVGYEGLWSAGGSPQTATEASAASASTAATYATNSIEQYYEAAGSGSIPFVYEILNDGYDGQNGWAVQSSIWNSPSPRLQGIETAEDKLPATSLPSGWTSSVLGGTNYSLVYFGTLSAGSATITGIQTTGLSPHEIVTGTGIPANTTISSTAATSIVLNNTVTTSASNEPLAIVSPQGNNFGAVAGLAPMTDTWTLVGDNPQGTFFNGSLTSDTYLLASTSVSGNATISAELTGITPASSNYYPYAGLVMRTSPTDVAAPSVVLAANGNGQDFFMTERTSEGGTMSGQSFVTTSLTAPLDPIQITGTISNGSNLLTGVSGLTIPEIGQTIVANNVPAGTTVSTWSTAGGSTTVTLSNTATGTGSISLDVVDVPVYMKLAESASGAYNAFTGYLSYDGVTWTTLGTLSIAAASFATSPGFAAGLFQDVNDKTNSRDSRYYATFKDVSTPHAAIDFPNTYNSTGYQTSASETNLREDFTVPAGQTLTIDNLLAFAGAGSTLGTTTASEVVVQIWNTSGGNALSGTGPISGLSATFSSTNSTSLGGDGYYALDSFSPVALSAGNYAIIATYQPSFSYYNSNIAGSTQAIYNDPGSITFPVDDGVTADANLWYFSGSSFSSSTTWSAPASASFTNAYGAGSMIIQAVE